MSEYSSTTRTFVATQGIQEHTLNPPNDLLIDYTACKPVAVGITPGQISPHGRIIVEGIGLFSNFADGLVFKNPYERISITGRAYGAKAEDTITVNASCSVDSKTINGCGISYDPSLESGDLLLLTDIGSLDTYYKSQVVVVDEVADTTTTITQYPDFTLPSDLVVQKIDKYSEVDYGGLMHIGQLNTMYSMNWQINPSKFSPIGFTNYSQIAIVLQVNGYGRIDGAEAERYTTTRDITFLTKSINSDYADDKVWFDIVGNYRLGFNQI